MPVQTSSIACIIPLIDSSHQSIESKESLTMYLQFPWKLHEMLRGAEESHPSVVSWLPHGKAFLVHNPEEFVTKVMPLYFRQTHYKSFQRQLNLWGFERIGRGPEVGAYYHEVRRTTCKLFSRGFGKPIFLACTRLDLFANRTHSLHLPC